MVPMTADGYKPFDKEGEVRMNACQEKDIAMIDCDDIAKVLAPHQSTTRPQLDSTMFDHGIDNKRIPISMTRNFEVCHELIM